MHLCRGNCLSQVLPGTFIVSPDTEYSTPLSRAVALSAAWPPPGKGLALHGGRFDWGMGVGTRSGSAVPPTPHLKMRRPGAQARAQHLLSQPGPPALSINCQPHIYLC